MIWRFLNDNASMAEPMRARDAASRVIHARRGWFHRWFYKRELETLDYCYVCAEEVDIVVETMRRFDG